ncbi:MAG: hypothetical protein KH415_20085 [Clostridium sp.]|nr:hypothetical protein [Clostridium sp.]
MEEIIRKALSSLEIKSFYSTRGDYIGECIVYNYISKPGYYADNREKSRKYTILLNIYSTHNIEDTKKNVIEAMINSGFKAGEIQKTQEEVIKELTYFNTPMIFKKVLGN